MGLIAVSDIDLQWALQQGGLAVAIIIMFLMMRREDKTRSTLAAQLTVEQKAHAVTREELHDALIKLAEIHEIGERPPPRRKRAV